MLRRCAPRNDGARHEFTFSRRACFVRALPLDLPTPSRGHGECRALAAPMARLRKKVQAAGTTSSAETSRHSPRDGFNGCFAFSPVRRAFWPPCAMMLAHQRGYQRRDIRTTRLDRAHRCCSSAWINHAATSTRPPHPASTSVTTAKRPSCETGWYDVNTSSDKKKQKYLQ